jgi:hypothetical protein
MKTLFVLRTLLLTGFLATGTLAAQDTFGITGTTIPSELLKLNYGPMPKGIQGFDINICNLTDARHPITSSEIYQAMIESHAELRPIGRQIMLAAILRNQNHSLRTWLNLGLGSTTSVLSVIGQGRRTASSGTLSAIALGALVGQQLLATWNPVLTADQVEKFESQVLEPALVMDGGSCIERTVFATAVVTAGKATAPRPSVIQVGVR